MFTSLSSLGALILLAFGAQAQAQTQAKSDKVAMAHFMVSEAYAYQSTTTNWAGTGTQWGRDIAAAKQMNLDGFVLNFWEPLSQCGGGQDWFHNVVKNAHDAAKANDFKIMLSFDTNQDCMQWNADLMYKFIEPYLKSDAFVRHNGAIVLSTFGEKVADSGTWASVLQKVSDGGDKAIWAPCLYQTSNGPALTSRLDQSAWIGGFCNWDGFPDMGVKNNASAVVNPRDVDMYAALKAKRPDGPYIMTAAPYQHKAMTQAVAGLNWAIAYADYLFPQRFDFLVNSKPQDFDPDIVMILTWNDYGESHYIKDISTVTTMGSGDYCEIEKGGITYVKGYHHDAWRTLAKFYLRWWKDGAQPWVFRNQVVYWYRTVSVANPCQANGKDKMNGQDTLEDVMVAWSLTKDASDITLSAGSKTTTFSVGAQSHSLNTLSLSGSNITPQVKIAPKTGGTASSCSGAMPFGQPVDCNAVNLNAVVNLCGGGDNAGYKV